MSTSKPLVIIVSGAPGSGKTTLAHTIAAYMRLPHVERDVVLKGLEYTNRAPIDRAGFGVLAYYRLLVQMIKAGMSLVTDGTIYKGVSEHDIKTNLLPIAHVINVHVRAKNEHQRFYEREMNREGSSKDWVEGHMAHLEKIYLDTVDPLELGVKGIEVDATSGYSPLIREVVSAISQHYEAYARQSKPRVDGGI